MHRLSCSESTPKERNLTSGRCCVLGERLLHGLLTVSSALE